MTSKKEIEADNVELRKLVERTAGDLGSLADELDFVFDHGRDAAVGLLATRARSLSELLATTLLEEFDVEAVGWISRLARHWIAKAVAVGLVEHFSAKYGGPAIEQTFGAVAGSLDSLLEAFGVASDLTSSISTPSTRQDATVRPETVTLEAEVPSPTEVRGTPTTVRVTAGSGDLVGARLEASGVGVASDPSAYPPHEEDPAAVEMSERTGTVIDVASFDGAATPDSPEVVLDSSELDGQHELG